MQKPFKYSARHQQTGEWEHFDDTPVSHQWEEYLPIGENTSVRVNLWDTFRDARYKAKLRLYNYITYTKNGLAAPRFNF